MGLIARCWINSLGFDKGLLRGVNPRVCIRDVILKGVFEFSFSCHFLEFNCLWGLIMRLKISFLLFFTSVAANAQVVFQEQFDSEAFVGVAVLLNDSNDNWSSADYYAIKDVSPWTFGSDAYWVTNRVGDGAIMLNETRGMATLSLSNIGLNAGSEYDFKFNLWGDNRPGNEYGLQVFYGAQMVHSVAGRFDYPAGYYDGSGGLVETFRISYKLGEENLVFRQASPLGSDASPIIDRLIISQVPEPSVSSQMLLGMLVAGVVALRRRASSSLI